MPELIIDNFSAGEVTQPSDTDIPLGAATKAQNVDLFDEGKLKKQKGNLKLEDGPTGVTQISAKRYEWNLPSPVGRQKTWIVYGTDAGGRDELWWKPYWDPESETWVDSWQELTEFEGPLTMDAGTTTTNIRDAGLASATADYYNTWVIVNITRQKSMIVTDYTVGATQDLTIKHAITGQTTGDTYFIYRFPLIMPLEGPYTADAGTSTTELVDTELRADVDNFYAGYKLVNTTRSITVTVTSSDANNTKLVHPTIAGQVATDNYYVYKEDHNIRVEDVVRFFPRENSIEMSLGNDEAFPLKAPLWFGYISERWYFNPNASAHGDTTFKGFWLSRNVLQRPDTSAIDLVDVGSGTLADDTWYVKFSYVYDGYQEGPLSESQNLDPTGTNELDIDIVLPYAFSDTTNKPGVFDAILDKRITHVRVYAAKGSTGDADDQYFLLREVPIVNLFVKEVVPFTGVATNVYQQLGNIDLDDEIWNGTKITNFFQGQSPFGKFLRWDINQGHKAREVDANFKFRATLNEQHYKAPIFTDIKRDAFVGFSVQSNGSGVPVDDVIPLESFINLSQKGIIEITGLASAQGYLLIFTPNRVFRYADGQFLLEFVVERGSIASDSIKEIDGFVYFAAANDFYRFEGNRMVPLMFNKIEDQWRTITTANKRSAKVGYFKNTNSIWLLAGGNIFIYDINNNRWRSHSTSITPVWFDEDQDGELYIITSNAIYEVESTTFTETILMDWRSKVISFVKEVKGRVIPVTADIRKLILKHKGDNRVVIEMFDPSYSETYSKEKVKFFPESLKKPVSRDVSFEANQIKFHISDEDTGATQPSHEIDYLKLDWEPVE